MNLYGFLAKLKMEKHVLLANNGRLGTVLTTSNLKKA